MNYVGGTPGRLQSTPSPEGESNLFSLPDPNQQAQEWLELRIGPALDLVESICFSMQETCWKASTSSRKGRKHQRSHYIIKHCYMEWQHRRCLLWDYTHFTCSVLWGFWMWLPIRCHLQSEKKYLFRLGFCHVYSPQKITVSRTNSNAVLPTRFTELRPSYNEPANILQHYRHEIITLSKTASNPTPPEEKLWCVEVKTSMFRGIRDSNLKMYHWYKMLYWIQLQQFIVLA